MSKLDNFCQVLDALPPGEYTIEKIGKAFGYSRPLSAQLRARIGRNMQALNMNELDTKSFKMLRRKSGRVLVISARPSQVDHPRHYNANPSGVECITVVEHMGFNVGNAMKYLWRADEKDAPIEDLEKAAWYVAREISRRKKKAKP